MVYLGLNYYICCGVFTYLAMKEAAKIRHQMIGLKGPMHNYLMNLWYPF